MRYTARLTRTWHHRLDGPIMNDLRAALSSYERTSSTHDGGVLALTIVGYIQILWLGHRDHCLIHRLEHIWFLDQVQRPLQHLRNVKALRSATVHSRWSTSSACCLKSVIQTRNFLRVANDILA